MKYLFLFLIIAGCSTPYISEDPIRERGLYCDARICTEGDYVFLSFIEDGTVKERWKKTSREDRRLLMDLQVIQDIWGGIPSPESPEFEMLDGYFGGELWLRWDDIRPLLMIRGE